MREKLEVMEDERREEEEEEERGHHVNSVLSGDNEHWEVKQGRVPVLGEKGEKGDRGLRGPPGMTVRGPPGPAGSPGRDWLDTALPVTSSCGCNQSLLRLYVQDLNPKLIAGPMGPPGAVGPVGPSGLPVITDKNEKMFLTSSLTTGYAGPPG